MTNYYKDYSRIPLKGQRSVSYFVSDILVEQPDKQIRIDKMGKKYHTGKNRDDMKDHIDIFIPANS